MAESLCERCHTNPARVAICAYRFVVFSCAPCGLEIAKQLIAGGQRVSVDAVAHRQPNAWTTSAGEFFDRDADAKARQAVLDERAKGFARRLGRIVTELQQAHIARRAA
jgi:hypothetical protein